VLLYVYPFTVVRQRIGKHVLTAMNAHATTDECHVIGCGYRWDLDW
jgi:hypothetical protein